MDTLYRIARVFGMTLSDLISLAENQTAHLVREEKYKSGDFTFQRVTYGNVRTMHAFASRGARLSKPELHRDDYELLWVLRGILKITLPNESYELTRACRSSLTPAQPLLRSSGGLRTDPSAYPQRQTILTQGDPYEATLSESHGIQNRTGV